MCPSLHRCLLAALLAALAGCRSLTPGTRGLHGACCREPQRLPEELLADGIPVLTSPDGPAVAEIGQGNRMGDVALEPMVTTGVLLLDPEPTLTAAGPAVGPDLGFAEAQAVPSRAPVLDGARCILVGKLEAGAERGTWNLRYQPEPGINRPGGVVSLVASQPLCGCHEGWEAQVTGFWTSFGSTTAFQVEHLSVGPPRVGQVQPAAHWEVESLAVVPAR